MISFAFRPRLHKTQTVPPPLASVQYIDLKTAFSPPKRAQQCFGAHYRFRIVFAVHTKMLIKMFVLKYLSEVLTMRNPTIPIPIKSLWQRPRRDVLHLISQSRRPLVLALLLTKWMNSGTRQNLVRSGEIWER